MSFGSARPASRVLFFLFAVVLLAGCPAPPKSPPRVTPLTGGSLIPRGGEFPKPVSIPGDPALAPPRDIPDSILPGEQLQFSSGLLPLDDWANLCGFDGARVVEGAVPYTVELECERGILTLILGRRFAKWNGIQFGLGFVPDVRQGKMVVHSVDVLKNFYPLSLGAYSIPKRERTLVLDPGHGGTDPGSLSSGKTHEKELTLDWALRIERLLAGTGWKVVLTRRDDRDLGLLDRVSIADAHDADLFISLHFNALARTAGGGEESGIETYCLAPVGAPSNIIRNFEDNASLIYPNNEFDTANLLLAMRMHESLIKATGRRDRGVRRARFMTVLREQKRPAVLIEGGFLSNPAEASLIMDTAYRQQMAVAVCNALPN